MGRGQRTGKTRSGTRGTGDQTPSTELVEGSKWTDKQNPWMKETVKLRVSKVEAERHHVSYLNGERG